MASHKPKNLPVLMTFHTTEETREMARALAGGKRMTAAFLRQLIHREYARRQTTGANLSPANIADATAPAATTIPTT